LTDVADAVDRGDEDALTWFVARLQEEDGPLERIALKRAHLEQLGRARGVVLDLRRKDSTFRALHAIERSLAKLVRTPIADPKNAAELRAAADRLRQHVLPELLRLTRGAATVRVDRASLQRIIESVRTEATARWRDRVGVEVEEVDQELWVRCHRDDLHEIVANLVRNAGGASDRAESARVRVRVAVEEDPITAMERVAIRVADDASNVLTTAMVRSRFLEGGLGLAVDLAARHSGALAVEPEPGFSKAVVLRLPRVEITI
jgi:signal transduction histidine kinase